MNLKLLDTIIFIISGILGAIITGFVVSFKIGLKISEFKIRIDENSKDIVNLKDKVHSLKNHNQKQDLLSNTIKTELAGIKETLNEIKNKIK